MSQDPNYNPYGQNPPDPNRPPGTSYGSQGQNQGQAPNFGPNTPGQTPPGQNPNYGSYPPGQTPPGQNPNYGSYPPGQTPPGQNPNYGPYNPYTPNPPTPGPGVNPNYNPYDPYAPTVAGQGANPDYNPYAPPAPPVPPVPPPTQPSSRGISWKVITIVVLALVLVVGGVAFGLVSYNTTQTNNANATATAQTSTQTAHTQQTATVRTNATSTAATATAIASTYPFSANLKLDDPLTDNSKGYQWQTSTDCTFRGSAYHATDAQTNTYQTCTAINTDFSDFTFQVSMSISKGDGGGLTFRGKATQNQFYRFEVESNGFYGIFVSVDPTGTNTRTLTSGTLTQPLQGTDTISIVARGSTISVYVNPQQNSQPVATINDSTYGHGQIGVLAFDLTNASDVIFTNAKVWALPPGA